MTSFDTQIAQALQNLSIEALNPMQIAYLEQSELHKHTVLLSNTGSGKTLAFLLPLWKNLQKDLKGVQAIIIVPSRELAIQIDDVLRKIGTGFKATLCYGGHKREIEENNLIEAPSVIIGTPGRLADHIRRHNFDPRTIHTLIIDEFDKSLELGFVDEMQLIIESMPSIENILLTSATEAVEIPDFIGLKDEKRIDFIDKNEKSEEQLSIYTVASEEKDKIETLFLLLCQIGSRPTIIFCNHRDAVERVNSLLLEKGIYSVFYHGGMEQYERDTAMCKFRNGTSLILVTTDLASRGLDIAHIRNIIHYHLPLSEEVFTHRNGRTARMDRSGNVFVLFSEEEELPSYITNVASEYASSKEYTLPEKPVWSTLYISHGKKDKINKIDIVGFLTNICQLKKEDIGLIEVKDFTSFVAIRKSKMSMVLELSKDKRIKNKKAKMAIAK
jgi:superfamily II DNA/RNA helicase